MSKEGAPAAPVVAMPGRFVRWRAGVIAGLGVCLALPLSTWTARPWTAVPAHAATDPASTCQADIQELPSARTATSQLDEAIAQLRLDCAAATVRDMVLAAVAAGQGGDAASPAVATSPAATQTIAAAVESSGACDLTLGAVSVSTGAACASLLRASITPQMGAAPPYLLVACLNPTFGISNNGACISSIVDDVIGIAELGLVPVVIVAFIVAAIVVGTVLPAVGIYAASNQGCNPHRSSSPGLYVDKEWITPSTEGSGGIVAEMYNYTPWVYPNGQLSYADAEVRVEWPGDAGTFDAFGLREYGYGKRVLFSEVNESELGGGDNVVFYNDPPPAVETHSTYELDQNSFNTSTWKQVPDNSYSIVTFWLDNNQIGSYQPESQAIGSKLSADLVQAEITDLASQMPGGVQKPEDWYNIQVEYAGTWHPFGIGSPGRSLSIFNYNTFDSEFETSDSACQGQ